MSGKITKGHGVGVTRPSVLQDSEGLYIYMACSSVAP